MVGALSNKRNKLVANGQVPFAICFVITGIGAAFGKINITPTKCENATSIEPFQAIIVVSQSILLEI